MVSRKEKIDLPKDVEHILSVLHQHSKQSYLVGGCIRDILLGIEPKDYDFCTDLDYDKLLEIFKDYSPKEIGAHFGVIQIKLNGVHYEIAKFRKDIGISEDRREQKIEFTSSLEEDLKRRDFTINAIVYDGDNLIALNESQFWNIEDGMLVFMGNPYERINEDPLRIFRMIRFACTKDLEIDPNIILKARSYDKLFDEEKMIERLSIERIRDEFVKIIMSNDPYKGLQLLDRFDILKYIIPVANDLKLNQCNPYHNKPVIKHLFKAVEACEPVLELRLSALLHDIGKPQCFELDENGVGHFYQHEKVGADMAKEILTNLKFENKIIDRVCKLVYNHMNKSHRQTPKAMRKLINRVGVENMGMLFKLMESDIISSKPPYNFESLDNMKILFHEISKEQKDNPCLKVTDLAINGYDLIKLGYKGKEIGDKLRELHEIVLEHGSKYNNFEELSKYC